MLVSLVLSALIGSLTVAMVLSLVRGESHELGYVESREQWNNAKRILAQDVHSSSIRAKIGEDLVLTNVNGIQSRYVVNAQGQFVRIGNSGGSAVLMTGAAQSTVTIDGRLVHITVNMRDGDSENATFAGCQ